MPVESSDFIFNPTSLSLRGISLQEQKKLSPISQQPALPAQAAIAVFTTCRETDTLAIISQAQHTNPQSQKIAKMPRKRDLALTVNGNVNPVGTRHNNYLEATIGYIVGEIQVNGTYCEHCLNGKGRFPFCVTVTDPQTDQPFWQGACVNCRWRNHPIDCSLHASHAGNVPPPPPPRPRLQVFPPLPPPPSDDEGGDNPLDEDGGVPGEESWSGVLRSSVKRNRKKQTVHDEVGLNDEIDFGNPRGIGKQLAVNDEDEDEDWNVTQYAGKKPKRGKTRSKAQRTGRPRNPKVAKLLLAVLGELYG